MTYATWNPSDKSANIALSGSDLVATASNTSRKAARATIGVSSGKWYREYVMSGPAVWNAMIGVGGSGDSLSNYVGSAATGWGFYSYNAKNDVNNAYNNNINIAYGGLNGDFDLGNTIGVALDMNAGTITFYVNNVSRGILTGLSGTKYPMCSIYDNTLVCTANFGASALTYTPPTGYNAGLYTGGAIDTNFFAMF